MTAMRARNRRFVHRKTSVEATPPTSEYSGDITENLKAFHLRKPLVPQALARSLPSSLVPRVPAAPPRRDVTRSSNQSTCSSGAPSRRARNHRFVNRKVSSEETPPTSEQTPPGVIERPPPSARGPRRPTCAPARPR